MMYLKYLLIINHGKITFKDSKGVVIFWRSGTIKRRYIYYGKNKRKRKYIRH